MRVDSLPHRKWRIIKQQPSMLPGPAVPWLLLSFFPFPVGHPVAAHGSKVYLYWLILKKQLITSSQQKFFYDLINNLVDELLDTIPKEQAEKNVIWSPRFLSFSFASLSRIIAHRCTFWQAASSARRHACKRERYRNTYITPCKTSTLSVTEVI